MSRSADRRKSGISGVQIEYSNIRESSLRGTPIQSVKRI